MEWISVKEKFPEEEKFLEVLVTGPYSFFYDNWIKMDVYYYTIANGMYSKQNGWRVPLLKEWYKVDYWRYPNPYP